MRRIAHMQQQHYDNLQGVRIDLLSISAQRSFASSRKKTVTKQNADTQASALRLRCRY